MEHVREEYAAFQHCSIKFVQVLKWRRVGVQLSMLAPNNLLNMAESLLVQGKVTGRIVAVLRDRKDRPQRR